MRIRAEHRGELERLARYLLRPAIALDRLRLLPGGMVAYDLRAPWADGTTGFLFSPMEFIEKLAALVPPKGKNLIRLGVTLKLTRPHPALRRSGMTFSGTSTAIL